MTASINPDSREDEDTGCILAPACLSCPFPICKHDSPTQGPKHYIRNMSIRAHVRDDGWEIERVAEKFNLTKRSVERVMGHA